MLVRATDEFQKWQLPPRELDHIPEAGEKFDITPERFTFLAEENPYGVRFVEKVRNTTKQAKKKIE